MIKATKEREMAEWREEKAIAKQEREEAKRLARALWSEALEAKAAERQLQNDAKSTRRTLKKPTSKAAVKIANNSAQVIVVDQAEVVTARSRRGRQIKPPQRFDI